MENKLKITDDDGNIVGEWNLEPKPESAVRWCLRVIPAEVGSDAPGIIPPPFFVGDELAEELRDDN